MDGLNEASGRFGFGGLVMVSVGDEVEVRGMFRRDMF